MTGRIARHGKNDLILNVNKMVVDFRRTLNKPDTNSVLTKQEEVVEDNNYQDVLLDKRLDWKHNTHTIFT